MQTISYACDTKRCIYFFSDYIFPIISSDLNKLTAIFSTLVIQNFYNLEETSHVEPSAKFLVLTTTN